MPNTVLAITVDPYGQSVAVNITQPSSLTFGAYTTRDGSTQVTFPKTITTRTVFYMDTAHRYNVSLVGSGGENGNGQGGVATLDLRGGNNASLGYVSPSGTSQSTGTSVTVWNVTSSLSTATTSGAASSNVAAIQAAIDAATAAGGGTVYADPGTYYLNDHLLIKANVRLYMPSVTLKKVASATSNVCLIRNANPSATVPYTDSKIVIEGVTLDGNYSGNSATQVSSDQSAPAYNSFLFGVQGELSLIGVQDVVVRNVTVNNGNGFGIQALGQDMLFEHLSFFTARDGIHINGPSKHVTIRDVYGYSDDDFIAINAWDWHRSGPAVGDITDLTIERCSYFGTSGLRGTAGAAVKLLPGTRTTGTGTGTGHVRHVRISGLHAENAKAVLILSDYDQIALEQSGSGTVEDVQIDGGNFTPDAASNAAVMIWKNTTGTPADGQTALTVRNVVVSNSRFDLATNGAANGVQVSYGYTTLNLQGLIMRDCAWLPKGTSGSQFLNVQSKSVLGEVTIDGLTWLTSGPGSSTGVSTAAVVNLYDGTNASEVTTLNLHRLLTAIGVTLDSPVFYVNGIVDLLNAREWTMTFSGGTQDNHGIYFGNSKAQIKNGVLSGLNLTNPKELFSIRNGAAGSVICAATVRDCYISGCTHPVYVQGSGRQAAISFRGGNIDTATNLARVDAATLTLSFDGTTSSGTGATTINLVNTPTLRIVKSDRISLPLSTLALTPSDGDLVCSSATPSSVVSGTGAGVYVYRGSTGWVKLN